MKTSNEGTKYMLRLAEAHLVRVERNLEDTKVATEFRESFRFSVKDSFGRKCPADFDVIIKETDSYASKHSDYIFEGSNEYTLPNGEVRTLNFAEVKKSRIWKLETTIKAVKSDIEFFKTKIAEWKP